jgi:hypothetical protein
MKFEASFSYIARPSSQKFKQTKANKETNKDWQELRRLKTSKTERVCGLWHPHIFSQTL